MAVSIFSRKRDLAYLVYFFISIPITFMVDLQSIYPPSIVPAFMADLKAWYISTYNDQFFASPPPPFFEVFMWLEVVYHLPICLWAIGGLYHNSPKVPLVLLPFACEIFLSTLVCVVEMLHWPITVSQKINLTTLYGPYLALSMFMMVDMYIRLSGTIQQASAASRVVGKEKST